MENTTNQVANTKLKSLIVFKILFSIFYGLVTAFLIWGLIDSLTSNNVGISLAFYIALCIIIIGSIGYIIAMIFSITGFIISIVKKIKKESIIFIILTILPIITEGLFIILALLFSPN